MKPSALIYSLLLVSSLIVAQSAGAKPSFVLPETLYAAPGVECNIYYDGALDSVTPDRYAYEVQCAVGRCERRRWCWMPKAEDAGKRVPLVLRALDDDGTVAEAFVTVRVAHLPQSPDTRRITVSMLGASSANSGYPQRTMDLMRANGYPNYTPVGSHAGFGKPVVPGGVAHDCYGGFRWGDYLHRWWAHEYELPQLQMKAEEEAVRLGQKEFTIVQGDAYRLKSPLLHIGASGCSELDIPGWLNRINSGLPPDIITVTLGVNDICCARPETLESVLDKTFVDAEKLLSILRAAAPKAHIGVSLGAMPSDPDGFAENYGCRLSFPQHRRTLFAYNRRLLAFEMIRRDGNMSIIPLSVALDTENSFPKKTVPAHADTEATVVRTVNGLHTLPCGGAQLGDVFFAWLANLLDDTDIGNRN